MFIAGSLFLSGISSILKPSVPTIHFDFKFLIKLTACSASVLILLIKFFTPLRICSFSVYQI